jgi:hypothetical protein
MDNGGKTDIDPTQFDPFYYKEREKRRAMEKEGGVKTPVIYGFKIGTRFTIDVLPPKNGEAVFSVVGMDNDPPIEIGYIEKTRENVIWDIKLESLLDDIPNGKFRVLLAKAEVGE